jgi:MFS superfamily sulfate permease-like transporter
VQAFRRLVAFRRGELVIALAALAGVLATGILDGVLIAVAVSVAELVARVARPHDAILGLVPGLAGRHDIDDYPQAKTIPGLVVYRHDAPLFFANARTSAAALAAARCHEPPRWLVLNVEANVEVDFHRAGGSRRRLRRARPRRHDLRHGQRQAGPAGQAVSLRPRRQDRCRIPVPDPAHRGGCLPPMGRQPPTTPRPGPRRVSQSSLTA